MDRRVVITGLGLLTPLGIGVKDTWEALCAGKSGIGPIEKFDTTDYVTKIAGEVKDFDPVDFMSRKDAKRTQPFIAYAIAATRMAMEDSGLKIDDSNRDRVGVLTGCGLGGLNILEQTCKVLFSKGPKRVSPFFIPMIGFIFSNDPKKACALPTRPPLARYSRVSKAARKSTRGILR